MEESRKPETPSGGGWLVPMLGLLLAVVLGAGVFAAFSYKFFEEFRSGALVSDAYASAKEKVLKKDAEARRQVGPEGDVLDRFFYGPVKDETLKKLYQPLPQHNLELRQEYNEARTDQEESVPRMDRLFRRHIRPSRWPLWLALAGLILAGPGLYYLFRGFLRQQTRKLVFVMGVLGLLGGYFVFLSANNLYPMGIDLAGGTELVYRLEFRKLDERIREAEEQAEKQKAAGAVQDQVLSLQYTADELRRSREEAPSKATDVIRKRIDPNGTKGIPVMLFGGDRVRIQLPKAGPEEVAQVKRAIERQGRLTFHIAADESTGNEVRQKTMASESGLYRQVIRDPGGDARLDRYVDWELYEIRKPRRFGEGEDVEKVVVHANADFEGSRIVYVNYRVSTEGGGYELNLRFDAAGSAQFAQMTGENIGKRMAVVLDRVCHLAPVIQDQIAGECRITGRFSKKEAEEYTRVLTSGSLPVAVKEDGVFTVGPALGYEQIRSGVLATLIGTVLVALFMWFYYRLCGFVALICLAVMVFTTMGALGFFKATMTLPGIAGILLNLGMAVDANVLIYERMREEQARGRNLRLVVQYGFDRAGITILDSQLTTLLSAIIMYYLGSGPIRGFAVTLGAGVLVTLFANLWFCRLIFEWIVERELVKSFNMREAFKIPNINFMGMRRKWYAVTGVAVLGSLALFTYQGPIKSRLFDVDFTGGTMLQFNFAHGREQSDETVKEKVAAQLRPAWQRRLQESAEKLRTLARSGKTEKELRAELAKSLPTLARGHFGPGAEVDAHSLNETADGFQRVLDHFQDLALIVQSFGRPAAEGRYRSFTLTTRESDVAVIQALREDLLELFKEDIEPPEVSLTAEAIRLRLESKQQDQATPAGLRKEVLDALANLETRMEFQSVRPLVQKLRRDFEVQPDGPQWFVDLGPLPESATERSELFGALETLEVKHRAEGPIARVSSFGPQVAGDLGRNSLLAFLVALAGMWAYLWFRFEFSAGWGFGAIVAVFHDSTVAVGGLCLVSILGLMNLLVDLNVVAAVLTIIGYSVNDTIVIYDRIREVKTAHPTRELAGVINQATNETLSRTLITATTVWLALLSLLIFGGETIRGLAWTLFIGSIAGMYSTVFIASPLMMWWYKRFGASFGATDAPKAPTRADAAAEAQL